MVHALATATFLYRVTATSTAWPDAVKGGGAYFLSKEGSRYNRPDQLTVYCSEDPLVALTEGAFYQALTWQKAIASARVRPLRYPLTSEHLFWAFPIDPPPAVLDLDNPLTRTRFAYPPLTSFSIRARPMAERKPWPMKSAPTRPLPALPIRGPRD